MERIGIKVKSTTASAAALEAIANMGQRISIAGNNSKLEFVSNQWSENRLNIKVSSKTWWWWRRRQRWQRRRRSEWNSNWNIVCHLSSLWNRMIDATSLLFLLLSLPLPPPSSSSSSSPPLPLLLSPHAL